MHISFPNSSNVEVFSVGYSVITNDGLSSENNLFVQMLDHSLLADQKYGRLKE